MSRGLSKVMRASGCVHCRLSLLRTFTSISSLQWHATHERLRAPKPSVKKQIRYFSGAQWRATGKLTQQRGESEQNHNNDDGGEVSEWKSEASLSTPWYLQVDRPLKHPESLSERQRIPELPEFSPEILQPLLRHISIDLGLDDLSLLDLRNLDPPPALGSNLLMIIGTARSEKHLHVSADRLCRWLRSEYKLRPDADGLLGRNELKLKLKRKNRRAKLLGNGHAEDDIDDGIRTGWVCVNLGMVPSASGVEKVRTDKEGFVGFGRETDRTKIVIQMLVEEKREELDLERLWSGIKERQMLSNTRLGEEKTDGAGQPSDDFLKSSPESPKPLRFSRPQTTSSTPLVFIQSRGLHTSLRRSVATMQPSISTLAAPFAVDSITHESSQIVPGTYLKELIPFLKLGDYDSARGLVMDSSVIADLQNDICKEYIFSHLRTRLESIPAQQAIEEFGRDYRDYLSTPFLCFINEILSNIPSARDWEFRIWLYCFARELGHPGYPAEGLSILFEQLQLSGIEISRDMYLLILRSSLRTCGGSPDVPASVPDSSQLNLAVKVFQDMYNRTGNLLTEEVFVVLQESLATFSVPGSFLAKNFVTLQNASVTTCDLPVLKKSGIQSRLTDLMSTLQVKISSDDSRIRLMTIFAKQYDWVGFWKIWRSVARDGEPRSAALYTCMFRRVAETNHQKGCMNVLRTWIPEMDREEPQVMLQGEVLDAVRACLAVADPSVEVDQINNPEAQGEWLDLWQRCLRGGS